MRRAKTRSGAPPQVRSPRRLADRERKRNCLLWQPMSLVADLICGLTYSTAKCHARDTPNQDALFKKLYHPRDAEVEAMPITFDDDVLGDDRYIHHNALVISRTVSNYLLQRVLVSNGSSTNVLIKDAL